MSLPEWILALIVSGALGLAWAITLADSERDGRASVLAEYQRMCSDPRPQAVEIDGVILLCYRED
jgi:hypothetical protein